jgi:hypothetical protein
MRVMPIPVTLQMRVIQHIAWVVTRVQPKDEVETYYLIGKCLSDFDALITTKSAMESHSYMQR